MIELYFKNILLGTLNKKDKYIYNSSVSEKLATNNYFLVEYFGLCGSKQKEFDALPEPFARMYQDIMQRDDIKSMANIKDNDSEYDVLYNSTGIKQSDVEYNLKQKNTL